MYVTIPTDHPYTRPHAGAARPAGGGARGVPLLRASAVQGGYPVRPVFCQQMGFEGPWKGRPRGPLKGAVLYANRSIKCPHYMPYKRMLTSTPRHLLPLFPSQPALQCRGAGTSQHGPRVVRAVDHATRILCEEGEGGGGEGSNGQDAKAGGRDKAVPVN